MDEQTRQLVTDVVDGDSLEAALRDYGPAAIEDLLPRLRTIANALDAAHATGQAHGSLHPENIFVSAESTHVTGLAAGAESLIRLPYSAPELVAGDPAGAASDQFALAAITFEWLFGRRIAGPAVRPIDVRALPGVDRDAMAQAFTRALAPEPANRYPSCAAFANAIDGAVIPVLPLGGVEDEEVVASELALAPEAFDKPQGLSPRVPEGLSPPIEPVTSWQPSASYTPAKTAERFSAAMLIVSCLVGMVVGFAAGYMAKPRALQSGPPHTMAVPSNGTDGLVTSPSASARPESGELRRDLAVAASGREGGPAQAARAAARPRAAVAGRSTTASTGTLLVESRPPGAAVVMNGKPRGTTPLTVEALAPGSYRVTLSLAGYQPFATTVRVVAGERTRAAASLSLQE